MDEFVFIILLYNIACMHTHEHNISTMWEDVKQSDSATIYTPLCLWYCLRFFETLQCCVEYDDHTIWMYELFITNCIFIFTFHIEQRTNGYAISKRDTMKYMAMKIIIWLK